jgi:hypothetical protein
MIDGKMCEDKLWDEIKVLFFSPLHAMHLTIFKLLKAKEKFALDVGNFAILLFFYFVLGFCSFPSGLQAWP